MHPGDQSTNDLMDDTSTLPISPFALPRSHPLPIREFLATDVMLPTI